MFVIPAFTQLKTPIAVFAMFRATFLKNAPTTAIPPQMTPKAVFAAPVVFAIH